MFESYLFLSLLLLPMHLVASSSNGFLSAKKWWWLYSNNVLNWLGLNFLYHRSFAFCQTQVHNEVVINAIFKILSLISVLVHPPLSFCHRFLHAYLADPPLSIVVGLWHIYSSICTFKSQKNASLIITSINLLLMKVKIIWPTTSNSAFSSLFSSSESQITYTFTHVNRLSIVLHKITTDCSHTHPHLQYNHPYFSSQHFHWLKTLFHCCFVALLCCPPNNFFKK